MIPMCGMCLASEEDGGKGKKNEKYENEMR